MPFYPVPVNLMARRKLIEPAPEIVVLYRLAPGGPPAVAFPIVYPLGDAVFHVLRVCGHADTARALQGL